MIVLFGVFISIVVLTFGVVMIVMRPTKTDKAIEQRISTIRIALDYHGGPGPDAARLLKPTASGRFKWLELALGKSKLSRILHSRIEQARIPISAGALVLTCGGMAAAGFLITFHFLTEWPIALGGAALGAFVPCAVLAFKRSQRLAAFDAALPDGIDMMGRALRAGHSMQAAIEMISDQCVEPLASEFGEVFKQQNFGLPLRKALMHLLERIPSQDLRVLVTAILVQRDTGGNLVEILDRTANVIRDRLRIKREIRTQTAQGRMTGWILSLLPVAMFILINLVNPGYSHVLMVDPLGKQLVYVGIGLTVLGALVMRQIINGIDV